MKVKKMSNGAKFLVITITLAAISIMASGCGLTEQQQSALNDLQAQAKTLEQRASDAERRFRDTQKRLLDGSITAEDAAVVYQSIMEQVRDINESRASVSEKIEAAKEAGLPWYGYLLPILSLVSGVGGMHIRGKKWKTAFDVVSRGADAFASVATSSRGDTLGSKIEAELAATGLDKRTLTRMHAEARSSGTLPPKPAKTITDAEPGAN